MNSAINGQFLALNSKAGLNENTEPDFLSKSLDGANIILNLKPTRNISSFNKLDIFTKTSGAYPALQHPIIIPIPDSTGGFTYRTREKEVVLSGACSILLSDAAGYWGYGSLPSTLNTCYLYAIWDSLNLEVVFALAGVSGLNVVDTTTTVTDSTYFLMETSSTYVKVSTDYCVALAAIQFEYDTSDSPDYTLQTFIRYMLDKDPWEVDNNLLKDRKNGSENTTDEIWFSYNTLDPTLPNYPEEASIVTRESIDNIYY